MPDISMCKGRGCIQKDFCYRYTARPDTMQSYSDFYKAEGSKTGCTYYLWDFYYINHPDRIEESWTEIWQQLEESLK